MINVIGMGYIGLPTALMFAANGVNVIGTDINEITISSLRKGILTFQEDGMNTLFKKAIANGIEFQTKYRKTDIYIIAVPTPYVSTSKKIDPKYVVESVKTILDICNTGTTIVIESTISPGSIDKYIRPEIEKKDLIIGKDIHLVHAPERIIPGNMIYELVNNSRVIGADNKTIGEKIKKLYSSFCKSEIVVTDIRTAEMSKVVENTYRDINIAFANELAKICRSDNMDVYEIIRIANKHPRVNILQPGPGVGGHCISVDPWFLVGDYPDMTNLILTARKTNDSMPSHVLSRIHSIMKEKNIDDITKVGIYGLAYKENVDDTRESPTLQLLNIMSKNLASELKVYDPMVNKKIVENQFFDFNEFLENIEIIVIITAHDHIKENFNLIKNKIIFDTKNVINHDGIYKI